MNESIDINNIMIFSIASAAILNGETSLIFLLGETPRRLWWDFKVSIFFSSFLLSLYFLFYFILFFSLRGTLFFVPFLKPKIETLAHLLLSVGNHLRVVLHRAHLHELVFLLGLLLLGVYYKRIYIPFSLLQIFAFLQSKGNIYLKWLSFAGTWYRHEPLCLGFWRVCFEWRSEFLMFFFKLYSRVDLEYNFCLKMENTYWVMLLFVWCAIGRWQFPCTGS